MNTPPRVVITDTKPTSEPHFIDADGKRIENPTWQNIVILKFKRVKKHGQ